MRTILSIVTRIGWVLMLGASETACHKQAFLDKKPSTTLLVPTTLSDFQALMDNTRVFNLVPVLGEASADDYYLSFTAWQALTLREYNAYVWARDIYGGQGAQEDWNKPYQQVFYANVVLDGLKNMKLSPDSSAQWRALEGAALFSRAFAFHNLAQIFAPPYDSATAATDMGIPLRTSSGIDTLSARSSVQATYNQILNDLHNAEGYLPTGGPGRTPNRPVQTAAWALLARVYLSMRNYPMARMYADKVLQSYSELMDYNDVQLPLSPFNPETIYQASFLGVNIPNETYFSAISALYSTTWIDTGLLRSYDTSDLRIGIYFRTKDSINYYLRANYTGSIYPFGGLAVDELLLIRAEGAARAGDAGKAMNDVNMLLSKRWRRGKFGGYSVGSWEEALDTVLLERRKELAFRGLRWTDLRRLNKEGASITLTRVLVDSTQNIRKYTLAPNSLNFTLPIPPDVLSLNSSIHQNPRLN